MQPVDDIKQLALKLFDIEKQQLLKEKQEYSCAVVVVVTPNRRYYEEAAFNNKAEMDVSYGTIAERAKAEKAIAIITINTARERDVKEEGELESYRWGQLEGEGQPRCLSLTLSGPEIESLSLSIPFSIKNGQVVLGKQTDFEPAILNMFPNWP